MAAKRTFTSPGPWPLSTLSVRGRERVAVGWQPKERSPALTPGPLNLLIPEMATTSLAGARSRFFDLPAGTLGLSHCSRRAFALPPRPRNRRSRSPRRVAAARAAAPSRCCLPCCSCLRLLLCDCLRLLLLATAASCDCSLECLLMHCDCCCLRLYCFARCHSTA